MKDEEIINNEENFEIKGDIDTDDNFSDVTFVDSTEEGEALASKDNSKKLREDLKICRKEKEEYLTGWQRAKADYVNLQKELDLARINTSIIAKEKMTEKLLPTLDSFEMAFSNKDHFDKLDKDWQDGIVSIYQQLLSGLEKSGIEKIYEIEVAFDPNIHQSISIVDTDDKEKDHTVEKVLQVGYKIGERVIRPAKVTIYEYKK